MEGFLVIILLAIVFGGSTIWGITDSYLKHRRKMMELQLKLAAEQGALAGAKTERIEQRVRVLERIVTDKGIVVADEIEALRDRPLN